MGSIVNRLIGLGTDRTVLAFHLAGEIKMELPSLILKPDVRNFPGFLRPRAAVKRAVDPCGGKLNEDSEDPLDCAEFHSNRKSPGI